MKLFSGTQYSDWIPVPEDRTIIISELVEGKKFQTKTDKKIDGNNDIKWIIQGASWFSFTLGSINSARCNGGYAFTDEDRENMGFFLRAGFLTFLKTSTQLQIWFDGVLEVTWVYEDNLDGSVCNMRRPMTGLKFRGNNDAYIDDVSTHYRYQTGYTPIAKTRLRKFTI